MNGINSEYDFDLKTMVYIIDHTNHDNIRCISFESYLKEQEKHEGKLLVLAHPDAPVYFREG